MDLRSDAEIRGTIGQGGLHVVTSDVMLGTVATGYVNEQSSSANKSKAAEYVQDIPSNRQRWILTIAEKFHHI